MSNLLAPFLFLEICKDLLESANITLGPVSFYFLFPGVSFNHKNSIHIFNFTIRTIKKVYTLEFINEIFINRIWIFLPVGAFP